MSTPKTNTDKPAADKKAGRPAGSVTKTRDVVTGLVLIDKCPKCGCDKPPKKKRMIREGNASATVKGIQIQSYKHFDAVCANDDCGNVFLYREYTAAE
jgi:predicted nucleic-acid-binding Zn-ribbon protein